MSFDGRLRYNDDCPVCGRPVKAVVASRGENGPRVYNGECSQHDTGSGESRYIFHQHDEWVSDEGLKFTAQEFGTLMEWFMASDPFPISNLDEERMRDMLNAEAHRRGYSGWVEAYHESRGEEVPDDD